MQPAQHPGKVLDATVFWGLPLWTRPLVSVHGPAFALSDFQLGHMNQELVSVQAG